MEKNRAIKPMNDGLNFSNMPSWYVLCTNGLCPMQGSCLRHLAALQAPESLKVATCVMPKVLKGNTCSCYDKRTIEVFALGFSTLYDRVMKMDYTKMRKEITQYLHGPKLYYEYMRGDRPLSQEQQQWIRDYVKSCEGIIRKYRLYLYDQMAMGF